MARKYKKRKDGRYLVQIKKGVRENNKPDYENIYAYSIPLSKIILFQHWGITDSKI